MTKHTKIPLPGEKGEQGSLLERAASSFGLDDFGPAPMPPQLADAPIKRARPAAKPVREPAQKAQQEVEQPAAVAAAPAAPSASVPPRIPQAYEVPAAKAEQRLPVAQAHAAEQHEPQPIRLGGHAHPVDREHLRSNALIVPEDPVTELLEEFRIVKRQLIASARAGATAKARRILICSPHSGEGKTFCSANLAIAMAAERGVEVLLVDADFAKPSLPGIFGLPEGPGLMDALSDPEVDLESLPIRTDIENLWVLPAGDQSLSDTEYLASNRTAQVLDAITQGAPNRIVIFDTPPALAASPAAELAKHVGQAVLVARADFTGHTALEDAYRLLSGCPDIKLMLNAAQFSPSGRRFGTYYGREG
ncbi:MAG: P-loop NTPase [Alteripontixanthobacter sp.]